MPNYDNKLVYTYENFDANCTDTNSRYRYTTCLFRIWGYDDQRAKHMGVGSLLFTFKGQGHMSWDKKRLVRIPYGFDAEFDLDYLWKDSNRAKHLKKIVNKIINLGGCNNYKQIIRLLKELKIPRLVRTTDPDRQESYNDLWIPRPFRRTAEAYVSATRNGLKVMPPNHPFIQKRMIA